MERAEIGPSVTKYEVKPAVGVRVNRISNLADDLALALAAKDVRIEAPIPGKSLVGIEVPNSEIATVSFRELWEQSKTDPAKLLEIPLGKAVDGSARTFDLARMPHLLVAGSTGSGKSVAVNGIISSILMKARPDEVKFMMVDPKMVELSVYNDIPHLLIPVVTNPRKASRALQKVVDEMENRYELFSKVGARNIAGFNAKVAEYNAQSEMKQVPLPLIVVIVDELADLMMVASKEVEDAIIRLGQKARAAGIHMILATQRPSVDVISGLIKANVPSRVALRYHLEPTHGPSWMKMAQRNCSVVGTCSLNRSMKTTQSVYKDPLSQMTMWSGLSTLSKSRQKPIMMMPLIQAKYPSQTLMEAWVAPTRVILSLKRPRHSSSRPKKPVLR